jgi:DNA polymerase II large subunit
MNLMKKMVFATCGVLSVTALTACQSTPAPQEHPHHAMDGRHADRLSPEQRAERDQMRAEHKVMLKQMRQACDGKTVGQTVQVKAGTQTMDGQCHMVFQPDHKRGHEMRMGQAPMQADEGMMRPQRGEKLTDAQRQHMVQQFDQRLKEKQAFQQALETACKGQTDGKAVQIKAGDQTLSGKCSVRFFPNQPQPNTAPTANIAPPPAA